MLKIITLFISLTCFTNPFISFAQEIDGQNLEGSADSISVGGNDVPSAPSTAVEANGIDITKELSSTQDNLNSEAFLPNSLVAPQFNNRVATIEYEVNFLKVAISILSVLVIFSLILQIRNWKK